jgi:hypothetical protein
MTRFLFTLAAVLAAAAAAPGQPPVTTPAFLYGHDLKVRPAGQAEFAKDTPKVGVEFYHDPAGGAVLAISEAGSIAVAPFAPPGAEKRAVWAAANEFRARGADEESFGKAKKFGVEAFRDLAGNRLLYVSDQKTIALADLPAKVESGRDPAFHHGLTLKVRGLTDTEFANAKKFGVDVFTDANTGGLVYVSETGAIAAGPAPPAPPPGNAVKAPRALHGLTLKVRKGGERAFEAARTFAVEVFEDRNTGGLVYLTETGSVAVAPAPAEIKTKQKPVWTHGFDLRARKAGEEFAKATRYGVEAFTDPHTGHRVYLSETGAIAVLAAKP